MCSLVHLRQSKIKIKNVYLLCYLLTIATYSEPGINIGVSSLTFSARICILKEFHHFKSINTTTHFCGTLKCWVPLKDVSISIYNDYSWQICSLIRLSECWSMNNLDKSPYLDLSLLHWSDKCRNLGQFDRHPVDWHLQGEIFLMNKHS